MARLSEACADLLVAERYRTLRGVAFIVDTAAKAKGTQLSASLAGTGRGQRTTRRSSLEKLWGVGA